MIPVASDKTEASLGFLASKRSATLGPNDTNFSLVESTLEQRNLEAFGSDFDVSLKGEVLISNSMYTSVYEIESGDTVLGLDSSIANRKVVVYRQNEIGRAHV